MDYKPKETSLRYKLNIFLLAQVVFVIWFWFLHAVLLLINAAFELFYDWFFFETLYMFTLDYFGIRGYEAYRVWQGTWNGPGTKKINTFFFF